MSGYERKNRNVLRRCLNSEDRESPANVSHKLYIAKKLDFQGYIFAADAIDLAGVNSS